MKHSKSEKTNPKKIGSKNNVFRFALVVVFLVVIGLVFFYNKKDSEEGSTEASTKNIVIAQNVDQKTLLKGKKLFQQNCSICHGLNGEGQDPKNPMGGEQNGAYIAPGLNGTGHAWHHPSKILFSIIKEGSIAGDSPMKGFSGRLTDEEIVAVIQYFQSLWPEKTRQLYFQRNGE